MWQRHRYAFLSLLAHLYYSLLNIVFWLTNSPNPRKSVGWTDEECHNELLRMSAKKAAEQIRRKQISSLQLIEACIARAQSVQPLINAIVAENFESARREASAVDDYLARMDEQTEEWQRLATTKPLLGVPFTFKNNMDVKGFIKVAGCRDFLNNPPAKKDSTVMERLRDSGAILLALTNLPKLAMGADADNEVNGRTRNPYDLRRIPGGSSGGEAAIISSGASIFGFGNDLGGSVRVPAAMCGLFGLKPTQDSVPLDGFVPEITSAIARAQWSIGPLCRYAEDLPITFAIISRKSPIEVDFSHDFHQLRILYMEDLNIWFLESLHVSVRQALRKTVRFFEMTFNTVPQKVDFPLAHHLYELWGAQGFGQPAMRPRLLMANLLKLLSRRSQLTATAWSLSVLHSFVESRNEQQREFMLCKLAKLRSQITTALTPSGLLLLPVWPGPAPFHLLNLFTPFNLAYSQLFNVLGFPALVCPVGMDPELGIPLSIQLVGPPNSESLLMAAAREIEKAFGGWIPPGRGD